MSFSPRQSPFARSTSTIRGATPSLVSPTKPSSPSLSPERQSPFVRRPSQLANDRPKSPFARPASRLNVAETPEASPKLSHSRDGSYEQESDPFVANSPSPTIIDTPSRYDGAAHSSPNTVISPTPSRPTAAPAASNRPAMQRTGTSSTSTTVRPFNANPIPTPSFSTARNSPSLSPTKTMPPPTASRPTFTPSVTGYNHIPQPLLLSMRESFEVLDASNSGTIDSSSISNMLSQLSLDNSAGALSAYFPPHTSGSLNLARFLDTLAGPMAELSDADELNAAFGAFDIDDSGQIDLNELRDALLHTSPEGDHGQKLSEREVDGILGEFSGRRAFGGKGVLGKEMNGVGGKGRGEVFRYRNFMSSISGSAAAEKDGVAV